MAAEAEATQAEQPADQGLVEGSRASKRPAEDDAGEGQAKRARREPSAQPDGQEDTAMAPPPPSAATSTEPPKRDRDNSTVIVCGLPLTADQAELDKMFRDVSLVKQTTSSAGILIRLLHSVVTLGKLVSSRGMGKPLPLSSSRAK